MQHLINDVFNNHSNQIPAKQKLDIIETTDDLAMVSNGTKHTAYI